MPFWLKGIITGILWGLWHLIIFESFDQFGGLHVFVLLWMVVSVLIAYAMNKTNSLLVAASIHTLMILKDLHVTLICVVIWTAMIILWDKNLLNTRKLKTIS